MPDYIGEIVMRSGDQLPLLALAVENDAGEPVDLTDASRVDLVLTNEDGADPLVTPTNPRRGDLTLPASIVNAATGTISYDWQAADALRPGVVQLVVVAHFPTGTMTAPSDRSARITVRPDPVSIFGGTVPGRYDLNLYRGDTKAWAFRLWHDDGRTVPIDLTEVTPRAEIRNKPGGAIVVALACTVVLPNTVEVRLTAEASKYVPAHGAWDLQLTYRGGEVQTAVSGTVVATSDVTESLFRSFEEVNHA